MGKLKQTSSAFVQLLIEQSALVATGTHHIAADAHIAQQGNQADAYLSVRIHVVGTFVDQDMCISCEQGSHGSVAVAGGMRVPGR